LDKAQIVARAFGFPKGAALLILRRCLAKGHPGSALMNTVTHSLPSTPPCSPASVVRTIQRAFRVIPRLRGPLAVFAAVLGIAATHASPHNPDTDWFRDAGCFRRSGN